MNTKLIFLINFSNIKQNELKILMIILKLINLNQ